MNFWKTSLITALAFVGIGSAVVFSACEEDACLKLKCRNGGACTDGLCRCPSGYEGSECEYDAASKFVGHYYGDTKCGTQPPAYDSTYIFEAKKPNVLGVVVYYNRLDTIQATVSADGTTATATNGPNQRNVKIVYSENRKLSVSIDQTINGESKNCVFNGTK